AGACWCSRCRAAVGTPAAGRSSSPSSPPTCPCAAPAGRWTCSPAARSRCARCAGWASTTRGPPSSGGAASWPTEPGSRRAGARSSPGCGTCTSPAGRAALPRAGWAWSSSCSGARTGGRHAERVLRRPRGRADERGRAGTPAGRRLRCGSAPGAGERRRRDLGAGLLPRAGGRSPGWHAVVVAALVAVWGVRLALHVGRSSAGKGEDPRYLDMLAKHDGLDAEGVPKPGAAFRRVFLLQAGAQWVVSLPIQALALAPAPTGVWVPVAVTGMVFAAGGIVYEAVADAQL